MVSFAITKYKFTSNNLQHQQKKCLSIPGGRKEQGSINGGQAVIKLQETCPTNTQIMT